MKKLLLLTAIFLAVTFSFAQENLPPTDCPSPVNELGPSRIFSNINQSGIGVFEQERFTGIYSGDNGVVIGTMKDYSTGNYLYFGGTDSATIVANKGLPGINYYPTYNALEITAPIRFFRTVVFRSPVITIGMEDGPAGSLPIQGRPSSSFDEESIHGASIRYDDNFIYIKTSSGKWKRVALFDVDF